jgi:hypothetical protein
MEAPVRVFFVLAIAIAAGAIGFTLKTAFTPGTSAPADSVNRSVAASITLWPHEIHLNYKTIKELPVHEIKEPF